MPRKNPLSNPLVRLLASDEAKRQLSMGWRLDPKHQEAPRVPILDEIFNDTDLFTTPNHEVAPSKHAPVTPETPFATQATGIRGCNALVVDALFERQLLRRCRASQSFGNLASVYFFPPWHDVSHTRRSRPALVAVRNAGLPYNGVRNVLTQRVASTPQASAKSVNPMTYAVWRQKSVRMYRRALWAAFEKHSSRVGQDALDGLYFVAMRKVPTPEEAIRVMDTFMKKVPNASDSPGLNMPAIERLLLRNNQVLTRTTKEDWTSKKR